MFFNHYFGTMSKVIKMTLDELKTHCLSCTECELCKTRTQVVFGVGNRRQTFS